MSTLKILTKIKNLSTFACMKKTFWHQISLLFALFLCFENAYSAPAPRTLITVTQPDGTILRVYQKGDEFFHYAVSTDGYVLLPDEKDFLTYAVPDQSGALRAGSIIAANPEKRTDRDKLYLKSLSPGLAFSKSQLDIAMQKRVQRASTNQMGLRSANATGLINSYKTSGVSKSLVILVNFSDVKFGTANTAAAYTDMLNKEGYQDGLHVGSSRDYFLYNSGGLFTPNFTVIGPVTLPETQAYYGQNDSNGNDIHPALMVKEACELAAASVDFSIFDNDNNGSVDNVYVFYAGKGEADGGGSKAIWPHSWTLSGESLSLKLNGKNIQTYSCSSELVNAGTRAGIGTFTHEYNHILGLPDLYDSDYSVNGQSFNLEEWSIMAYGLYNGDGCVPPSMSILERSLLGWAAPIELNYPTSIHFSDFGSTNKGYIIHTNDENEYFLLENRQQNVNIWDSYLLHHGMLIYHIDKRSRDRITATTAEGTMMTYTFADLWSNNLVNAIAGHECADLVEADNIRVPFTENGYIKSVKGDPFPGSTNVRSFTDETVPSMRTWNGTTLGKPITAISENNGVVSFDFMGGFSITPPVALQATEVQNYSFKAHWKPLLNTTGYVLNVYKIEITTSGDTVKTLLPEYENSVVKDTFYLVNDLEDITTYCYDVRGTNNELFTEYSQSVFLNTTKATDLTYYAKENTIHLKGMDHGSIVRVFDQLGHLVKVSTSNKIDVSHTGFYLVESTFNGERKIIKVLVK